MFSPEFINLHAVIWHVGQVEALEPFGVSVEIVALYAGGGLLEADVIEAGKTCTIDIFDCVIRNKEVFLPPHKHVVCLL